MTPEERAELNRLYRMLIGLDAQAREHAADARAALNQVRRQLGMPELGADRE